MGGWGEVKRVHFLGPKGPLSGVPHPHLPKFGPGYGPGHVIFRTVLRKKEHNELCYAYKYADMELLGLQFILYICMSIILYSSVNRSFFSS